METKITFSWEIGLKLWCFLDERRHIQVGMRYTGLSCSAVKISSHTNTSIALEK